MCVYIYTYITFITYHVIYIYIYVYVHYIYHINIYIYMIYVMYVYMYIYIICLVPYTSNPPLASMSQLFRGPAPAALCTWNLWISNILFGRWNAQNSPFSFARLPPKIVQSETWVLRVVATHWATPPYSHTG